MVPVCREDLPLIRKTLALSGIGDRIRVFKNFQDVRRTLDRLEDFDVFVGEKLHSVILACCANTPSVMVE